KLNSGLCPFCFGTGFSDDLVKGGCSTCNGTGKQIMNPKNRLFTPKQKFKLRKKAIQNAGAVSHKDIFAQSRPAIFEQYAGFPGSEELGMFSRLIEPPSSKFAWAQPEEVLCVPLSKILTLRPESGLWEKNINWYAASNGKLIKTIQAHGSWKWYVCLHDTNGILIFEGIRDLANSEREALQNLSIVEVSSLFMEGGKEADAWHSEILFRVYAIFDLTAPLNGKEDIGGLSSITGYLNDSMNLESPWQEQFEYRVGIRAPLLRNLFSKQTGVPEDQLPDITRFLSDVEVIYDIEDTAILDWEGMGEERMEAFLRECAEIKKQFHPALRFGISDRKRRAITL